MENASSNSPAAPPPAQINRLSPADWPELCPLSLRLVIMSRSRPRAITSHRLFPSATLVVPESELADYAHVPLEKVTIPDAVTGVSAVRNWIVRHFAEDAIVMLDDDITACVCMVSLRCRKLSIEETLAMLENSAYCARGAGARLFGWHQRSDPRLLQRNDPFGVHHWVGGAVGVVRDANGGVPKWDELLKCKCDIDATLQELMDNRLVLNEARFCFVQERDKNLGGNSLFRSADRIAAEKRYLKRKWKVAHPVRGLQEPGPCRHRRAPAPVVLPRGLTSHANGATLRWTSRGPDDEEGSMSAFQLSADPRHPTAPPFSLESPQSADEPSVMRFITKRGYDFGEVSSAMQKAIRRGDTVWPAIGRWSCGPAATATMSGSGS